MAVAHGPDVVRQELVVGERVEQVHALAGALGQGLLDVLVLADSRSRGGC